MKKMLIVLLALLTLASVALADYHPATTRPPQGTISGRVTDASTARALQGVQVTAGGQSAATDAQGRYTLSLDSGSYIVKFALNDYVAEEKTASVNAGRETVVDCGLTKNSGVLKGVVTDAHNPAVKLQGVRVTAGGESAATDAQGCYTLTLKPGNYKVTFSKQGYASAEKSVTVRAGQTAAQDCQMTHLQYELKGVVSDATNPSLKLSGVAVSAGGQTDTTDSQGRYALPLPAGSYTVTFSKSGYIDTNAQVTVTNERDAELNMDMSRAMASNEYRVVLRWGETPRDLDSHLQGKNSRGTKYHVFFSNKSATGLGQEAKLDVDDTSSYGPETVSFTVYDSAAYVYYVHDYTNRNTSSSSQMGRSGATVQVYCGNALLQTFSVPSGAGIYWEVFRIENGAYTPVDRLVSREPAVN